MIVSITLSHPIFGAPSTKDSVELQDTIDTKIDNTIVLLIGDTDLSEDEINQHMEMDS